ncbi:MAG: hypothetical protein ABI026_10900 [Gemmatimonadaceae bacterium]
MTPERRVARTQSQLRFVLVVSAALWTGATLLAALAIELAAGAWSQGTGRNPWSWDVALVLAIVVGFWILWRGRYVLSKRRVALWMEERAPSLNYALVTASDPLATGDISLLQAEIDRSNFDISVRPAVLTPVIYAGVALSVMAGAFAAALTFASTHSKATPTSSAPPDGLSADAPNRLLHVTARISPPPYAHAGATTLDDPSTITGLVGGVVTITGSGRPGGIDATVSGASAKVVESGQNWRLIFVMPQKATIVALRDRRYDRVMAVIPVSDQPPSVVLIQPTRDTVWRRVPSGSISFIARADDDVGLANGHIEYTVTTGTGEIFKSRTSSAGATLFKGNRSGRLSTSLMFAQLGLTEGAILSVRAVVSDNNALTGPAISTSDTRTFRVARSDEYDSLAVEAAPPPPEQRSLLTQRMLIVSAESLFKKRQALAAREYIKSAGRIGADQADLRKKVYNILYEQDEAGGEGGVEGDDEELNPQLVINRDLKQAYDAMWDAERSLNIGEINIALPFMTAAAHALDRARLANRLYLRGRPPRLVVDIGKVRLTGKDRGVSNRSTVQRQRSDTATMRLNRSLDAALTIARTDPAHFVDALIRLRAESSSTNSSFSSSIGDAVDSLRAGKAATEPLTRARRALFGRPQRGNPALPWSGSWSGTP